MRERREEGYSWGKIGGQSLCLPSGGSRSAATAVLGRRRRRENGACAVAARGGNPACRGLRPVNPAYPAYIPQIPMRERRAGGTDGCLFSPHFVYIVYHKFWRLSKMESGRKWKGWKILEGAGLREMEIEEGACGKEWKGGQVGAT